MTIIMRIFGTGLMIAAVLIATILYPAYGKRKQFFIQAELVPAEVTRLVEKNQSFFPAFSYTDRNGETVEVVSKSGSNPPSVDIGEQFEIFVSPDFPGQAIPNTFLDRWLLLLIGFGIFASCLMTGLALVGASFFIGQKPTGRLLLEKRIGFNMYKTGLQVYLGFNKDKNLKNYSASWPIGKVYLLPDRMRVGTELKQFTIPYDGMVIRPRWLLGAYIQHTQPDVLENVFIYGVNIYGNIKKVAERHKLAIRFMN